MDGAPVIVGEERVFKKPEVWAAGHVGAFSPGRLSTERL